MIKNRRAITLVEIVVATVLAGALLLGAGHLVFSHARFFTTLQAKNVLLQEASTVLEDMTAKIRNSKYVDISNTSNPDSPEISLYDDSNERIGTYRLSENSLIYTDADTNSSRLVSDKIDSLAATNPKDPLIYKTKLVKLAVSVHDSRYPNIGSVIFTTSAYCHVLGVLYPVRLVHPDPVTNKDIITYFMAIQPAVDAAVNGDTVQVSFNYNVAYKEQVAVINKRIKILGKYDDLWERHTTGCETKIDGSKVMIKDQMWYSRGPLVSITSDDATVDGFTIQNNYDGPGLYVNYSGTSANGVVVSNNLIRGNNSNGGGLLCPALTWSTSSGGSSIEIANNVITGNSNGYGIGFDDQNSMCVDNGSAGDRGVYIHDNTISANYYSGVFVRKTFSSGATPILLGENNIIDGNGISIPEYGGGVYDMSKGCMTILNNKIRHNTALERGGGIYSICGGPITGNEVNFNIITTTSVVEGGTAIYSVTAPRNITGSIKPPVITNNVVMGNKSVTPIYHASYCEAVVYCEVQNLDTIETCRVTGNTIGGQDEELINKSGCPLSLKFKNNSRMISYIENNRILYNVAYYGLCGGIAIVREGPNSDTSRPDCRVANNLIAWNVSHGEAGGLYIRAVSDTSSNYMWVYNNTIVHNTLPDATGGGIFCFTDGVDPLPGIHNILCVTMWNNIVYHNGNFSLDISQGWKHIRIALSVVENWYVDSETGYGGEVYYNRDLNEKVALDSFLIKEDPQLDGNYSLPANSPFRKNGMYPGEYPLDSTGWCDRGYEANRQ